jgi:AcrR family transcriptional regulator
VSGRGEAATARGLRTRQRLLDAAEQLWGERGIEGVSMREIRLAAGQRNTSALQFHFGDRDGLLLALAQRHLPEVTAIQEQLYAKLVAEQRSHELEGLLEVLVRPNADYLHRGRSARAWVKLSAELAARPGLGLADVLDHAPAIALHAGVTLHERLAQDVGPELATERLVAVVGAAHHLCADRARAEDAAPAALRFGRPPLAYDAWLGNLLDMAVGALLAPARGGPPGRPLGA